MNNFGRDFATIVSGAKCRIKWCSLLCLSCHCVMALPPYGTSSKQQQLFSILEFFFPYQTNPQQLNTTLGNSWCTFIISPSKCETKWKLMYLYNASAPFVLFKVQTSVGQVPTSVLFFHFFHVENLKKYNKKVENLVLLTYLLTI
jgi:hypothetical protein